MLEGTEFVKNEILKINRRFLVEDRALVKHWKRVELPAFGRINHPAFISNIINIYINISPHDRISLMVPNKRIPTSIVYEIMLLSFWTRKLYALHVKCIKFFRYDFYLINFVDPMATGVKHRPKTKHGRIANQLLLYHKLLRNRVWTHDELMQYVDNLYWLIKLLRPLLS